MNDVDAYRFENCVMHVDRRMLSVNGRPVKVGARAFDVLQALIERRGHTVTRDELLDIGWRNAVVEENNLSVQISTLRGLVGRQAIATIPGVGYRFCAPLKGPAVDAPAPIKPDSAIAHGRSELIGRDSDLQALTAFIETHRLVTVKGPGGIGKTRLAQEVTGQIAHRFDAGAWFVEFSPLRDPALLPATVAQALGLKLAGERPLLDELADELADDARLLVLDNCEHVVGAASELADVLLKRTSRVHLLVTSQERLNVDDEHVYNVPPLFVPEATDRAAERSSAIMLLVARIQALNPQFRLADADIEHATQICRQLDGLPLAIELAAARVPLLGLKGVLSRLDDRLNVLTSGTRTGAPRHRTLRDMLAWSHGLLNDAERVAFRRAGVFSGSFGPEQVEHVVGADAAQPWDALDRLGALIDKSLVRVESVDPPRYRLLESARSYALEMLQASGELESIRRRHAVQVHALFQESLELEWILASQEWRGRFLPDLDNGRAALAWSATADAALYVGLAGAMAWLFSATGNGLEGLRHCQQAQALLRDGMDLKLEARLRYEICRLNHGAQGEEHLVAAEGMVELLRRLGDPHALYRGLGRLAITAAIAGDCDRGEAAVHEMDRLHDATWPPLSRWDLLNARDYLANEREQYEVGEALAAEELALARAYGDTGRTLFALMAAEQCAASLERYEEAAARGREVMDLAIRENEVEHIHVFVFNLAMSLALCGRIEESLVYARRSAVSDARRGSLWKALELMALLALRRDRIELAARIVGLSDAQNEWRDGKREPVEGNVYRLVVSELEARLTAEAWADLRSKGARMTVEELTRLALAE